MECRDVMGPTRTPLYVDDSAGTAIDFMTARHTGLVPVVDRDDRFVGMISGDRLMHFMMPHTVRMMRGQKRASYLRESREELTDRLEELRARPLDELVDRHVQTAQPETPLIDALALLSEKQFVVPIVDSDGRLVGAISFFSVLHAVREWAS